nr:hypothetical protein CFP56_12786 [Quercus suber]
MREVTRQPAGVDLIEVATGKNKEEVLGVEASGLDQRLEKVGPSSVKPKSTWTRFNRMDFGLGGLSKALQLPTHGKRSSDSTREEDLCDHSDFRETKRGKVGDNDVVGTILSTGVDSHPSETKVQTLINSELGVWKSELVQQLFLPQEASIILGIPLSRHCPPDKVAWAYTPLGAFSTSNAYKRLASDADGSQAESSNRYDGKTSMENVEFHVPKFWVQIHNLPFAYLSASVAMEIGKTLGNVVSSNDTSEMVGLNFIRFRVAIDITQPLCQGRKISFDEGKDLSEDFTGSVQFPENVVSEGVSISSYNSDVSHMVLKEINVNQVVRNNTILSGASPTKENIDSSAIKPRQRTWTRKSTRTVKPILEDTNFELGPKRKPSNKVFGWSIEKKAKLEEETKQLGLLMAKHLGSMEVAVQPRQKQ